MPPGIGAIAALALLGGCPHPVGPAAPAPRSATYDVVVAAASAERVVTSIYAVEVLGRGEIRTFTTLHAEGTWEESGTALAWDSDQPRPADPWPLTLQHAISTVPTRVHLDDRGAPDALVDPASWRQEAMERVQALDLPVEALAAASGLVDPEGVVGDLRRSFPGLPPEDGVSWERPERIAGVPARRSENCTRAEESGQTTWTCQGEVLGPRAGSIRLVDTASESTLRADRKGLVSYQSTYEGVLKLLDPDGDVVVQRAVVGRRLVQRR